MSSLGDPTTGTGTLGQGQTIVLVDSYGSPTAASDLQFFHDTFYPNLPNPDFEQIFPNGKPNFSNPNGNGQSGPSAAANWSGEATVDIEWAYAIAPLAHLVLIAVPPAETEGVQGVPNLFKAMKQGGRQPARRDTLLDELRCHRADVRRGGEAADVQVRRRLPEGDREGRHVLHLVR